MAANNPSNTLFATVVCDKDVLEQYVRARFVFCTSFDEGVREFTHVFIGSDPIFPSLANKILHRNPSVTKVYVHQMFCDDNKSQSAELMGVYANRPEAELLMKDGSNYAVVIMDAMDGERKDTLKLYVWDLRKMK